MPLNDSNDTVGTPEPPQKKKKKRTATSYALSFFLKIMLTALVLWILLTWIIGIYVCHENSAYPMIKDGDFCLTYRLGELKQGEEIVYKADGAVKFGRIIAFEGDSVEILSDYITVNGYGIFEDVVYPTTPQGAEISFPYIVSENCVFVLNDYRSDISDSRTFGGIPLDDVQGKVVFIMRRRGI